MGLCHQACALCGVQVHAEVRPYKHRHVADFLRGLWAHLYRGGSLAGGSQTEAPHAAYLPQHLLDLAVWNDLGPLLLLPARHQERLGNGRGQCDFGLPHLGWPLLVTVADCLKRPLSIPS